MAIEREINQELERIKEIAHAFGLNADFLGGEDARTVGVQGDGRT